MNLTKYARAVNLSAIAALMTLSAPALAGENPKVAAEVIALARAQWASEAAGQAPAQQLVSLADDYTEFNADYPTLLVGKAMATQMAGIVPYAKTVFADMQSPRVQVYGDTAILTYNYAGITMGADGKSKPAIAKSTRVYAKEGGRWMLVHGNFAPVQVPTPLYGKNLGHGAAIRPDARGVPQRKSLRRKARETDLSDGRAVHPKVRYCNSNVSKTERVKPPF